MDVAPTFSHNSTYNEYVQKCAATFSADDDNNTDAADASNIGMIEKKKHIKKEPMKNCTLTVQLPCYYIGVYCELM